MMPLGKAGSPQDTLTEVVVSSLKWMKLGALGAATHRGQRGGVRHSRTRRWNLKVSPPSDRGAQTKAATTGLVRVD